MTRTLHLLTLVSPIEPEDGYNCPWLDVAKGSSSRIRVAAAALHLYNAGQVALKALQCWCRWAATMNEEEHVDQSFGFRLSGGATEASQPDLALWT